MKLHLSLLLFLMCVSIDAISSERDELGQVQKLLNQIEVTLIKAKTQASTESSERYFFDYQKLHSDIQKIRTGIESYLIPERSQPRKVEKIQGQYRLENKYE